MSQHENRPVIDFDHHSGEFGQRSTEILREHRERCPIGFSQQYGGFWTVFSHALGMSVFRDYDHFSTSKYLDEDGQLRGGLTVPTLPALDLIPNELDPPEWNAFTPIQALARSATGDVEVGGQCISEREPVLISMASMNRDDAVFDNPDEVVLDRWPNRHVGFGLGMHRCLGSNFARAMFQIILTRVLQRLPDYRVDRSAAVPYASMSTINGWVEIPVTFTPGPRVAGRTEERHASPS